VARKSHPVSAETKAKIGAANRGKVKSPELRARMSAAMTGKKRGPYPAKHGAAISAAKKGRPQTEAHREANRQARLGFRLSDAAKAKIGASSRGKKRPPFSDEWRQRIGDAQRGRKQSAESNAKRSAALSAQWRDGSRKVCKAFRYTSLARALESCLVKDLGIALEPEVRFGRFSVDLYDRTNHTAYEADGRYWHDRNEAKRPGYHAERDAYLVREHGLIVVRYDEIQIAKLQREGRAA